MHLTLTSPVQSGGRFFTRSNVRGYCFGFQGQLMDDELYGDKLAVIYEYRIHNPLIGRFFSVDPLDSDFPWNSPYAFSENRVISAVELEGLEAHDLNNGQTVSGDLNYNVTNTAGAPEMSLEQAKTLRGYKTDESTVSGSAGNNFNSPIDDEARIGYYYVPDRDGPGLNGYMGIRENLIPVTTTTQPDPVMIDPGGTNWSVTDVRSINNGPTVQSFSTNNNLTSSSY